MLVAETEALEKAEKQTRREEVGMQVELRLSTLVIISML